MRQQPSAGSSRYGGESWSKPRPGASLALEQGGHLPGGVVGLCLCFSSAEYSGDPGTRFQLHQS
jgi:hypothetical protein